MNDPEGKAPDMLSNRINVSKIASKQPRAHDS